MIECQGAVSQAMDRVISLLERERPLLDEIFGTGQYHIEDETPDDAIVRSPEFTITIGYDRNRDRSLYISVILPGMPHRLSVQDNGLETWARFLGEDYPGVARDARGVVTASPEQQLRDELNLFARYKREIFSDPQTKRDAAFFADGYNTAYNDWASREGSWSENF